MFVHKYQPCPVSISLDYAGPQVSVAVIIVTIIAVVYCCVLQLRRPFLLGISDGEREIRGLSSIFAAARKYGSG